VCVCVCVLSDGLLVERSCNGAPTGQHTVLFRFVTYFRSCAKSEALRKVCNVGNTASCFNR